MNFDPLRSLVILLHWLIVGGPHMKKVHPFMTQSTEFGSKLALWLSSSQLHDKTRKRKGSTPQTTTVTIIKMLSGDMVTSRCATVNRLSGVLVSHR